jgi:hypothetical protein
MLRNGSHVPDRSRCFGHYRAQSPFYALTYCVKCPLLKSCVRTAWGLETRGRARRRDLWQQEPRLPAAGPDRPQPQDYAAT